jgi:probable F420-dependent oxidoreductase
MKFDVTLSTDSLRKVPQLAAQVDALGVDCLWTTETAHNPFLPLALAAEHTQRTHIGTAITVAFPRSPMVMAQLAWDLAEQSEGRFILGLGTQVKAHIVRRFSSVWDSPGPRMRDYILSLQAIWNAWQHNKPLKYEGEFYKFSLMTPFFAPSPLAHPQIPIYIAGLNPYLCKLAGELCQGFHVHPFHTRRYLNEIVIPNVTNGAEEAGRTRADVALTCAIFVVTGATSLEIEANKNAVKAQIAFYASTPSYEVVLQVHGWEALGEQLNALSREGRWLEMAGLISDEMLEEVAVIARYDQLATKVRERYEGLLDRIGYYFPFDPSVAETLWVDGVRVLSDTKR